MFITAPKIHDGISWLPEGSVIEIADDGTIIAIHDTLQDGTIHYDGILTPGFVNVHCHLELSHMKGAIPEHTGLVPFLQQVMQKRFGFTDEQKAAAREQAINEMYANGIVAVGDICNTTDVVDLRASGKMHFHSFVEAIGFNEMPTKQYDYAVQVYNEYAKQPVSNTILRQSNIPHAPYSVSHALFKLIDAHNPDALISIHNQESEAEDEFYIRKEGAIRTLLSSLGIDDSFFHPSGKSSLQTYMRWMSPTHPLILVHNTYTPSADAIAVQRLYENVYWCLCPNANLYIENKLPDINMLLLDANNICIGTDSLSSNHQLSVLAELQTIKQHYYNIDWATLLRWATYNGAKALQMQDTIGKIEESKKPGIVQVTDLETNPIAKRII
ncbi:MAG: amidohydrolase family protein [Bacteroidetes bacterium]|nr:amidohydrolase family protein [Bacteroidota bacterium]